VWHDLALPKIYGYYDVILADFSVSDVTHTLHYLLKILENMSGSMHSGSLLTMAKKQRP